MTCSKCTIKFLVPEHQTYCDQLLLLPSKQPNSELLPPTSHFPPFYPPCIDFKCTIFTEKKKKRDSDAFQGSHLHGSGRTIKKWKKTPLPVHSPLLLFPFPFNLPVWCKTSFFFFFLQMLSGLLLCWDTWATKNISRGTTFPTSKTVLLPSQGRENRAIWW